MNFWKFATSAVLAVPILVGPLTGQATQSIILSKPIASLSTEFSMINGVREFADGSLLVADPIDNRLYRVDAGLRSVVTVGRNGSGPGEYKQPDGVFALPGDSVLVTDLGNGRLMEFDAQMKPGRTIPIASGGEGGPGQMSFMLVNGVDGKGQLYFRAREPGADSSRLVRYDRTSGSKVILARLKEPEVKTVVSGGANNRSQSMRQVPLSAQDGWAVRSDGTVYLVRSNDYRIEAVDPNGRVTRGPVMATPSIPIGKVDKEEWAAQRGRSGGLSIGVEDNNGQLSVTMQRSRTRSGDLDDLPWPENKPPFDASQIWVDGKDRLWVGRQQPAGSPPLFDVFDATGKLIHEVRLSEGRKIVGMGANSVFVSRYDEDDLQYLEKYTLPL